MSRATDYYLQNKKKNESLYEELKRNITFISYIRLIDFIVGLIVSVYTYYVKNYVFFSIVTIVWIGIFIYLVIQHGKAITERKYVEALIEINQRGIDRTAGEWKRFKDTGSEFIDQEHPYSGDLDIFGESSLFQCFSSCATYMGRKRLAEYFLKPLKSMEDIITRQSTVKELCENTDFRQKINAEAMLIKEKSSNPEELIEWSKDKNFKEYGSVVKLITYILPVLTIITVLLVIFTERFTYGYIILVAFIDLIVLKIGEKERVDALSTVQKYKNEIKIYEKIITHIENENFESENIKNLKAKLIVKNEKASDIFNKLKSLANLVSDRYNLFYIIINILLMWDYRSYENLIAWKKRYGMHISEWLEVIAEFEALGSLSNISFENAAWCYPKVGANNFRLKADKCGHPLLGEKRVANDFIMSAPGEVVLITGSNMSGKSTFLRTLGINMLLAYCGAPVCAENFETAIMDIYTCMRISDNLSKNISSFYAEILRIKTIVNASKQKRDVFFLLDEIFKGTNSIDRHQGAKYLIKQLSANGATGLVSTHDLELGELENEMTKLKNYHFQEHYEDDKLCFDYKLKKGISTTRNAMHIIKLAGIEVEE
ncbi:MutS family DNA mismatch repair protein [Clostridium oryzae]|uniref:DNA mismatch repair protein MutS n=1 Tax=Clostridium oryzae TaxID=1450648 RepID=A0A1V4IYL0_9CLOT|nr:MutS family DNA mismatch repair protein [Clostridium oryzae]OPJ65026.1 DNA mismatch repair protein MutS [Clostridium oryzae]